MAIILILNLKNQQATQEFSQRLAHYCPSEIVIYLEGDLGAGKTTLARGFIQTFGFDKVKSPTYSLVESYQNSQARIHHFDCYRVSDPEELNYIGIREYQGIQVIEWAKLGGKIIAPPDITITLSGFDKHRRLHLKTHSDIGNKLKKALEKTA